MEIPQNMPGIKPVKFSINSKFTFRCHKEIGCFTKCCRGINIILTPYDIVRLKNRLGLSSNEFLAIYTVPRILEKTDLPVVTLKLMDDELTSCPFVKDNGCIIYQDDPQPAVITPSELHLSVIRKTLTKRDFIFL